MLCVEWDEWYGMVWDGTIPVLIHVSCFSLLSVYFLFSLSLSLFLVRPRLSLKKREEKERNMLPSSSVGVGVGVGVGDTKFVLSIKNIPPVKDTPDRTMCPVESRNGLCLWQFIMF